ncbi:hypothetical protein OIU84_027417 [Salix udensis]|uniref:Uncharacterized protein n=1 Tax=Salix udensis TaxID=889485 RepID=A0AAD6KHI0_9ROSI|nr:hypothetical protein OIU84_027417 [Salix udensis]
MAEEAAKAMEPNADALEWSKKDKHPVTSCFVYSSGDLERTIKITLWAEEAAKAMEPNADALEWPKKDKHCYFMLCIAQNYVMAEEAAKAMEPNADAARMAEEGQAPVTSCCV